MSKRNLKTWVEAEIHPSAYDLAECFWSMDEEEQAGFFHRLYEVADLLPMQLQAIIDSPHFTMEAKLCMQMIGEYGEATK